MVVLQPIKYLDNLIEQDHRFIKRRTNLGMRFWSFDTACRTIQGYEAMHQLRKGQVRGTSRRDIKSQVRFVSAAFGLALYSSNLPHIKISPCLRFSYREAGSRQGCASPTRATTPSVTLHRILV